jgi:chromosome partitioning protein
MKQPHIIVIGNEKGGTGKSTIAMHIAVYLLNSGFNVCTIDIDARQGTFTQYFKNREKSAIANNNIRLPIHIAVQKSSSSNRDEANTEELAIFTEALKNNWNCDFFVIDTPGNDTFLSQLAHSHANTLITPMNESMVDLDVLVKVSADDQKTFRPSVYAEMVWNQRKERAKRGQKPLDWVVTKNRMTTLYNEHKEAVNGILEELSRRIGFRLGTGFCERVIFKDLFVSGLTLLDFDESSSDQLNLSHVAARQEHRELINFLKIVDLQNKLTANSESHANVQLAS